MHPHAHTNNPRNDGCGQTSISQTDMGLANNQNGTLTTLHHQHNIWKKYLFNSNVHTVRTSKLSKPKISNRAIIFP